VTERPVSTLPLASLSVTLSCVVAPTDTLAAGRAHRLRSHRRRRGASPWPRRRVTGRFPPPPSETPRVPSSTLTADSSVRKANALPTSCSVPPRGHVGRVSRGREVDVQAEVGSSRPRVGAHIISCPPLPPALPPPPPHPPPLSQLPPTLPTLSRGRHSRPHCAASIVPVGLKRTIAGPALSNRWRPAFARPTTPFMVAVLGVSLYLVLSEHTPALCHAQWHLYGHTTVYYRHSGARQQLGPVRVVVPRIANFRDARSRCWSCCHGQRWRT